MWEIKSEFYNAYVNPIEALKAQGNAKETIDFYVERQRREEPMDYYIHYIRYYKNVVVILAKASSF